MYREELKNVSLQQGTRTA